MTAQVNGQFGSGGRCWRGSRSDGTVLHDMRQVAGNCGQGPAAFEALSLPVQQQ